MPISAVPDVLVACKQNLNALISVPSVACADADLLRVGVAMVVYALPGTSHRRLPITGSRTATMVRIHVPILAQPRS